MASRQTEGARWRHANGEWGDWYDLAELPERPNLPLRVQAYNNEINTMFGRLVYIPAGFEFREEARNG